MSDYRVYISRARLWASDDDVQEIDGPSFFVGSDRGQGVFLALIGAEHLTEMLLTPLQVDRLAKAITESAVPSDNLLNLEPPTTFRNRPT